MDSNSWTRLRPLGEGSFGAVSLSRHTLSDGLFTVKSVDINSGPLPAILSLRSEIQILRSLSSPYVVSYLGHDTTQQSPSSKLLNLHIEYMPGGTAADAALMDDKCVRDYTFCITHALHYLHFTAGIVHGDVKGRNILLDSSPGVAKLADFGTAKRVGGDAASVSGTPLWMAPEVARGEGTTPASDVWSLGCTVIEMAGGAPPWISCGVEDVGSMIVRIGFVDGLPELPSGMSEAGRDFVEKCLRRDAAERWSCRELLQHPFLAGGSSGGVSGISPRSVLDGVNLEFNIDYSDEDEDGQDWERVIDSARERIRGLVSKNGPVNWTSEGWENVRGTEMEPETEVSEERGLNGGQEGCSVFMTHNNSYTDCNCSIKKLDCILNLVDSWVSNESNVGYINEEINGFFFSLYFFGA